MTANLVNEDDFDRAFRQRAEDLDKAATVARDACCGQCGGECHRDEMEVPELIRREGGA